MKEQKPGITVAQQYDQYMALPQDSEPVAVRVQPVLCSDTPIYDDQRPCFVLSADGALHAAYTLGSSASAEQPDTFADVWPAASLMTTDGPGSPRLILGNADEIDRSSARTLHVFMREPERLESIVSRSVHFRFAAEHKWSARDSRAPAEPVPPGTWTAEYRSAWGDRLSVRAPDMDTAHTAAAMLLQDPPVQAQYLRELLSHGLEDPFGDCPGSSSYAWVALDGQPVMSLTAELPPAVPALGGEGALMRMAERLAQEPGKAWPQWCEFAAHNPGMSARMSVLLIEAGRTDQTYRTKAAWEQGGNGVRWGESGVQGHIPAKGFDGRLMLAPATFYSGSQTEYPPPLRDKEELYTAFGAPFGQQDMLESAIANVLVALRPQLNPPGPDRSFVETMAACQLLYRFGITPHRPMKALAAASAEQWHGQDTAASLCESLPGITEKAVHTAENLDCMVGFAAREQEHGFAVTVPVLAAHLAQDTKKVQRQMKKPEKTKTAAVAER